MLPNQN